MDMKNTKNLAVAKAQFNLLFPYVDKWVALNNDKTKVVASGGTIKEVEYKLAKNKQKASEPMYVAPFDKYFVPICA